MSTGRIQFAEQSGTFVLKFVGEVRLTLCSALDATIEKIFTALNFSAIVIDLTETEHRQHHLSLLAKLSILSRQKVGLLPTVVTPIRTSPRLLQSMGFDQGVQYRRSANSLPRVPDRPAVAGPERRRGAFQGAGGAQDPHGPE